MLGCMTLLFGVVVLAWPRESARVLAVLFGIWLLMAGITRILAAFLLGSSVGHQLLSGIVGIVYVLAGTACVRDVTKSAVLLALVAAAGWILSGLAELVVAVRSKGSHRRWLGVLAVASILIGFIFLLWPGPSITAVILLIGFSALVIGVSELAVAFQLRRSVPASQP